MSDIMSKLIPKLAVNDQLLYSFIDRLDISLTIKPSIAQEALKLWCNRPRDLSKIQSEWTQWREMVEALEDEQLNGNFFNELLCLPKLGYVFKDATEPMQVANFLLNYVYKGDLFRCGKEFFLQTRSLFKTDKETIKEDIIRTILNNDFFLTLKEDKKVKVCRYTMAEEIAKMAFLNTIEAPSIREDIDKESKGKLFFENGFWDFKNREFKEYGSATLITIPTKLNLVSNPELRKQIQDRILSPIFNDVIKQDWFMYIVSRMIAGCREDKSIYIITGARDCGKGVLSLLLENCFKKYISTIDLSVFAVKTTKGGDAGRENSFALALESARIALMNESTTAELDGNKLKQIFSGGDSIMTRKLHHENQEMKIQASPLLFCNETPRFNCDDVSEKIYELHLTSKFINSDFPEDEKLSNVNYFQKDDSVKERLIYDPAIINEFILMLLESYYNPVETPEAVKSEKRQNVSELEVVKEAFISDPKGFMTNKEIKATADMFGIKKSQKELKRLILGLPKYSVKEHTYLSKRGLKGIRQGILTF